jgi:hypothetical protein
MPNTMRVEGRTGRLLVGNKPMASLQHWKMEQIGQNRYAFEADDVAFDEVYWPFRDRDARVVVELPLRRSTLRFRVMLTAESPLCGEATLDANEAEEQGDFW